MEFPLWGLSASCKLVFKGAQCSFRGGAVVYIRTEAWSNMTKHIYMQFFHNHKSKEYKFEASEAKQKPRKRKTFFIKKSVTLSKRPVVLPRRTTNCLPLAFPLALQASQRHVCFERIFWLWWTKNPSLLKTMQD